MHSINVSCLVFHDHSIFISTEAVEGSPGWEGIPAPAVQDIPEEAEQLRTGEEEPRTAADSKPAGDMPGYQELQLEVGLLPRSSGGSFGCSHQVPLEERFQGIPLVLHRGNLK